jgi:hypothetical protein
MCISLVDFSSLSYGLVLLATAAQFVVGAAWYTAFGSLWGKIHGFDQLSKEVQQAMMKKMGPVYLLQAVVTLVTTIALASFMQALPDVSAYCIAFWLWIGFVVTTQISSVVFSSTDDTWKLSQIAIMSGASFLCVMVGAAVLSL